MKVRMGFISNSSSSSFVLAVKEETHKKILKNLDDFDRAVIKAIGKIGKAFGNSCYIVGDMSDAGGDSLIDDMASEVISDKEPDLDINSDEYDEWSDIHSAYSVINRYEKELKKFPKDQSFSWSDSVG